MSHFNLFSDKVKFGLDRQCFGDRNVIHVQLRSRPYLRSTQYHLRRYDFLQSCQPMNLATIRAKCYVPSSSICSYGALIT